MSLKKQKKQKLLTKTIKEYIAHCNVFHTFNTAKTYTKFANNYITSLDMDDMFKKILQLEVKDSTKNTYIAALNSFQEFIYKGSIPFKKIKVKGTDQEIPSWYSKLSDIFRILSDNATSPKATDYDKAIYILIRTGLRYGNAINEKDRIDFSSIDWSNIKTNTIRVKSKGNQYKWVVLPPELDYKLLKGLNSISKTVLKRRLNQALAVLDIKENITVHKTRYFFANYNKRIGLTIDEIMKLGGWNSSAVMTYLYDNVDEFQQLSEFQYLTDIEQIERLDLKGQRDHYKKMYLKATRKLNQYVKNNR